MKSQKYLYWLIVLLSVFFWMAACKTADTDKIAENTQKPGVDATSIPSVEDTKQEITPSLGYNWQDKQVFRLGLVDGAQDALDETEGASEYHIKFTISDNLYNLEGYEEVRYTNREDVDLDEIYFQLFPNASGGGAEIDTVKVDDEPVEPEYLNDGTAVRLTLSTALAPGDSSFIEFGFVVDVAREPAGNYGTFGYFEDVLVLDEFYPVIPVFDENGWNYSVPTVGDLTYLDASYYIVEVNAPKNMTLVASGVEISQHSEGERQVVTFAAGPARDFYLAASDKFEMISKQVGETTINSYALSGLDEGSQLALEAASQALVIFNGRYGEYPYTELDVVSTPLQALGIEYPGLACITLKAYDLDSDINGTPAAIILESVAAHEVGHQFFYNVVGNDQVRKPWLDESLVQYITGLYYLDRYSPGAFQSLSASWYARWDRIEREEIPIGLPSEAYHGREYSAIVYGRGPIFMGALSEEMGEESFDAFLRDYYQSNRWGIGIPEDFQGLAEKHCNCDLAPLFEEWVYE